MPDTVTAPRPWTAAEVGRLRELRAAGLPWKAVARRLGRGLGEAAAAGHRAGLCRPRVTPSVQGTSAGAIPAGPVGTTPPAPVLFGGRPPRSSASRGGPGRRDGLTYGRYVAERQRTATLFAGRPGVSRYARAYLEAVESLGPATPADLAAKLGRSVSRTRQGLARLAAAGHLVVTGTRRERGDRPARVYALAPAVAARRERVLAYQSAQSNPYSE